MKHCFSSENAPFKKTNHEGNIQINNLVEKVCSSFDEKHFN